MNERGFTLVEAIVSLGVMGIVLASAMGVVAGLPRQAAQWEEAADARQRLRVIDGRGARLASGAAPFSVRAGATDIRVPAVWPRRLGLIDAGAPGDVTPHAVTFLSRAGAQRMLRLDEPLAAAGGTVSVRAAAGCGAAAACRVSQGDIVLGVSAAGDLGLFRVSAVSARLTLDVLMRGAAFPAGSVLVPVTMASLSFADGELRVYDGYRSDAAVVDGLAGHAMTFEPPDLSLHDGPWQGTGPLAFDADQLQVRAVTTESVLAGHRVPGQGALLVWGIR